jgi:hypothetical protein
MTTPNRQEVATARQRETEELIEAYVQEFIRSDLYADFSLAFADKSQKVLIMFAYGALPTERMFHILLDGILRHTEATEGTGSASLAARHALEHPSCPEEHLRRALRTCVPDYRYAAFHNKATHEDALVAYWLARDENET